MKEKDNILRILKETQQALKDEDFIKIKNLSNQIINTASLTQDPDNIVVAVVVYSLNKIFGRENYKDMKGWKKLYSTTEKSLELSIKDIQEGNIKKFRKDFEKIRKAITQVSGELKSYIEDVFRKASINKASKLYEHGISMERTASLLGITMYELASYTGSKKEISDASEGETMNAKKRIKLVEDFFK